MKSTTHTIDFATLPTTYDELFQKHVLRPIHDNVDLENAAEIIDAMAGHDLNQDQQDYLDVLSTLAEEYESREISLPPADPIAVLKDLLDEAGMNASDLGRLLGNRELGSKILRGERKLSLSNIQTLASRFAVTTAAFIPVPPSTGELPDADE